MYDLRRDADRKRDNNYIELKVIIILSFAEHEGKVNKLNSLLVG